MKNVVIALALVIAAGAAVRAARRQPARRHGLPQTRMRR